MIPGMNPREMQKAMKRLGIQQQELEAEQVIIKLLDKDLVINHPQVLKVNMMGQETFQISGTIEEHSHDSSVDLTDEDIETVAQQANVTIEAAKVALEKHNGDLAQAILELKKE